MNRKFSKLGYSLTQRGKRSWRVRVALGANDAGDYEFAYKTIHADTKTAARRLAEKFRDEVEAGYDKDVANKTVSEFFSGYLKERERHLQKMTLYNYRSYLSMHDNTDYVVRCRH